MLSEDDKQWVKQQLDERIEQLDSRFTERLEAAETRFTGRLERVETNLLTAFHKWASPIEIRLNSHAGVLRALDVQVETVASDIKDLQIRVQRLEQNLPNSPRQ